ncbi:MULTISPECIES: DUF456 domain-containing protein [unclassified Staphylococcus]|uniref:DUF456 domain-containing protein n=1 Tax=unclassified Staphylococcus TaxID=91994 RepID=UPI0021CED44C|nr:MULTISPECIES: DUF456 domain-containing protein [unclassified Staphylococcus]UXR78692.1 DUF456 domain-containing protein [Staphylococcus sp. IVB6227]UXR82851.1 DUF456 domain-containing protein [Staphylococcus sp. IVB6214]
MDTLQVALWLLILSAFALGFISLIKPIIPGVLLLWIGFFIYHWGINSDSLSWWFWGSAIVWTLFIFISDLLLSRYFVNRFGGSKTAERTAIIAVIVGAFVFPPFGILIVPFIAVLVVELLQGVNVQMAMRASVGTIAAIFTSSIVQAFIMTFMIVWFFIDALVI